MKESKEAQEAKDIKTGEILNVEGKLFMFGQNNNTGAIEPYSIVNLSSLNFDQKQPEVRSAEEILDIMIPHEGNYRHYSEEMVLKAMEEYASLKTKELKEQLAYYTHLNQNQ